LELDADPDAGKDKHLETPIVYAACLEEDNDAEIFLDELVCWFGTYEVKELIKIVKGSPNSTGLMSTMSEKYDDSFTFFDGDSSSRIELLKYLDGIYKENVKPLEYYENLEKEEQPKKKKSKKTEEVVEEEEEEPPKKKKSKKSEEKEPKKKKSKKTEEVVEEEDEEPPKKKNKKSKKTEEVVEEEIELEDE
jgi:hypothetical protein